MVWGILPGQRSVSKCLLPCLRGLEATPDWMTCGGTYVAQRTGASAGGEGGLVGDPT